MLSLTRYPGQRIRIGDDIIISIRWVKGQKAQIDIEAPREIPVHREEVYDRIQAQQNAEEHTNPDALPITAGAEK